MISGKRSPGFNSQAEEILLVMDSQSSDWLEAHLSHLHSKFPGFAFRQTTVSVSPADFEKLDGRGNMATVYARIMGSNGVLAVPNNRDWRDPGGIVKQTESLTDAAITYVKKQTGIECRLEDVQRANLICIKNDAGDGSVLELSVIFEGTSTGGTISEDAAWRESVPEMPSAI